MNPIHIFIKKLGRVKESQLDILPFVIFSGESGLGKSYMALLCHYFFEILVNRRRLSNFFNTYNYDYKKLSAKFQGEGTALNINKKDLENWLAIDAVDYIGEMLGNSSLSGDIEVQLPYNIPSILSFNYKEELTGLVNAEDVDIILSMNNLSCRVKDTDLSEESPFAFLLSFELINYIFGDFRKLSSTFVFPPSRGPVMTEQMSAITGMYHEFVKNLNELNRTKDRKTANTEELLSLFYKILDGDVERIDNKYIYKTGDAEMPISAAAASIREIAPLELMAKKVDVSTASVLFEEPEAHLHPLKQRMMADILSAFHNSGAFMQITTHSDYLIRRLNELIMLFEVRTKFKEDEDKYISLCEEINTQPNLSLSTDSIAAYIMMQKEDGSSYVQKQNLGFGVPYNAFSEAISRSMSIQNKLETIINDEY